MAQESESGNLYQEDPVYRRIQNLTNYYNPKQRSAYVSAQGEDPIYAPRYADQYSKGGLVNPWDAKRARQAQSIYDKPAEEPVKINPYTGHYEGEEKSVGGFFEFLADDFVHMGKGFAMMAVEAWNESIWLWDNAEDIGLIFNKTLPAESQSRQFQKTSALNKSVWDWMDTFQLGKEVRFTADQIIEATISPYEDGLVEAIYHRPFTFFLDLTAVVSLIGKAGSLAGNAAIRSGSVAAKTKYMNRLRERPPSRQFINNPDGRKVMIKEQGSRFDQKYRALFERPRKKQVQKISQFISDSPYLAFKAPFKVADNSMVRGAFKETGIAKKYVDIKSYIAGTPTARAAIKMWGSIMGKLRMEVNLNYTHWSNDLPLLIPRHGERAYWHYFYKVDELGNHVTYFREKGKLKHTDELWSELGLDVTSKTPGELGKKQSVAQLQVLKEKASLHSDWSFSNAEAAYWDFGWRKSQDGALSARAHSLLAHLAFEKAELEIGAALLAIKNKGGKTAKKYMIFGEEALPATERQVIHQKWRDKYVNVDYKSARQALAEVKRIIKRAESEKHGMGKPIVPYAPFVQAKTMDVLTFTDVLTGESLLKSIGKKGNLEKRFGRAAITMDVHTVAFKHFQRAADVKYTLQAVSALQNKWGKKMRVSGDKAQANIARTHPNWEETVPSHMLNKYFDSELMIQRGMVDEYAKLYLSISEEYKALRKDPKRLAAWYKNDEVGKQLAKGIEIRGKVHKELTDDLVQEMSELRSAQLNLNNWSNRHKHLELTEKIRKTWEDFLVKEIGSEWRWFVPKEINRVIHLQIQSLTGGIKLWAPILNQYRFMALNLFPRFYINNYIGNSILTLFSGAAHPKYAEAKNLSYKYFPEAMQNVITQEPNAFIQATFRKTGWSRVVLKYSKKMMQEFQVSAEYTPRILAMAQGYHGSLMKRRYTRTLQAAGDFDLKIAKALESGMEAYRKQQVQAGASIAATNQFLGEIRKQNEFREELARNVASQVDLLDELKGKNGTMAGKAKTDLIATLVGDMEGVIVKLKKHGASDQTPFIKWWDEQTIGGFTHSQIAGLIDYIGKPGRSKAWEIGLSGAVGRTNLAAQEILNGFRQRLTGIKDIEKAIPDVTMRDLPNGGIVYTGYHGTYSTRSPGRRGKTDIHSGTHAAAKDRLYNIAPERLDEMSPQARAALAKVKGPKAHEPSGGPVTPGSKGRVYATETTLKKPYGSRSKPISEVEMAKILRSPRKLAALKKKHDGIVYINEVEDAGKVSVLAFSSRSIKLGERVDSVKKIRPKKTQPRSVTPTGYAGRLDQLDVLDMFVRNNKYSKVIGKHTLESMGIPKSQIPALIRDAARYRTKFRRYARATQKMLKKIDELSLEKAILKLDDALKKLPLSKAEKIRATMFGEAIDHMEVFFGAYNSIHPIEKALVRNIFPFWTFPKTMFMLMFRYPGIRPKSAALWAHVSEYMIQSVNPDTATRRFANSIALGGYADGFLRFVRYGSWNPFDGNRLMRIGNAPIFPQGLNPVNANPAFKVFIETTYGRDTFTGYPAGSREWMSPSGEIMEPDPTDPGKFRFRTPQKPFLEAVASAFLPHWRMYREITDPNATIPKIPGTDEYPYERKKWWGLMRLLGVGVTIRDAQQLKAQDYAYRTQLYERIRKVSQFYGKDEKEIAEKWWKMYLIGRDQKNGGGDNFMFNPRF